MSPVREFEVDGERLRLSGDTYTIRDRIKSIGGRWDPSSKSWLVPASPPVLIQLESLGFVSRVVFPSESQSDSPSVSTNLVTEVQRTWTVRELVEKLARIIEEQAGGFFWLRGEISGIKVANGHHFFELAEELSEGEKQTVGATVSISCALWANKRRQLIEQIGQELPLQEGTKVRLLVHCELRTAGARVNAIVEHVDLSYTLGDLALQRQRIVNELRRLGLYEANRRRSLPLFPLRIALLTAANSRAALDFIDELKRSKFAFRIHLFDVNMQGVQTRANVCAALQQIENNKKGVFDCIVLTRGGGSRLDLRWFDDLDIAKQIAYATLPVITAIGHTDDVSVADEVSWKMLKTPTAAAQFLAEVTMKSLELKQIRLERVARRASERIAKEQELLSRRAQRLVSAVRLRVDRERRRLDLQIQSMRIVEKSVQKTLDAGFALIRAANGKILRAVDFLHGTLEKELTIEMRLPHESKRVIVVAEPKRVDVVDGNDCSK